MTVYKFAYFPILGFPLIIILGVLALLLMTATAIIPLLLRRGVRVPFAWHVRLAQAGLIVAAIHGLLIFLTR